MLMRQIYIYIHIYLSYMNHTNRKIKPPFCAPKNPKRINYQWYLSLIGKNSIINETRKRNKMLQPNAKVKVNKFTAVHYMLNYVMFILLYSRLQQFVHKYSIVNPINLSTVTLLAVYPATDISLPLPISLIFQKYYQCSAIITWKIVPTSVLSLHLKLL